MVASPTMIACLSRTPLVFWLFAVALAPAFAATLERGNGPEPGTLDAHRCQEVACGNVLRDVYEGLVTEAADGALIPGLAARWNVSPDGLRWRFALRPGLKWSNGAPLNAAEIVASFQRALDPATAGPFAAHFGALRHADAVFAGHMPPTALGVSAPDARTVQFDLVEPAPLLQLLTLPSALPVYLPALAQHGSRHTRPGNLVGTGAYRLIAWAPQSSIELERNPYFHAAREVAIERVRFHVTEDAASELKRFMAGGLDITETVPPGRLERYRVRFGSRLRVTPYLGAFWLGFNLSRPPFRGNRALREALILAVDRPLLTRYITALGEQSAWSVVPPGVPDYTSPAFEVRDSKGRMRDAATLTHGEREALARQRFAEAGYDSSRPLRIELRYNTSTQHRRMALAVAAMWREVLGVRAVLRNEEWKVFVTNRGGARVTEVFRGGWIGDYADARSFLTGFAEGDPLNTVRFADPLFDALVARAGSEPKVAVRNHLLALAEARLLDARAVLPLYFYTSKHLVAARVAGFEANPLDRHASRWMRVSPSATSTDAAQ